MHTLDNIYQSETLRSLKLGYFSGHGQPSVATRSSFVQYLKCSSPTNKMTYKWHHFLVIFKVSGPTSSCTVSKKLLFQCRGTTLSL